MPQAKARASGRVRRRPSAACVLMALSWTALAAAAGARPQQPDLAKLDLRVRSADVAAPKRPESAEPPAPAPASTSATRSDVVEEVDRAGRGEIPSRLSAGSSGDGGVLEDLLEDHTIPLFRVRVKPPL